MVLLNTAVGLDVGIEVGGMMPGILITGVEITGAFTVTVARGLFTAVAALTKADAKEPLATLVASIAVATFATATVSTNQDG